MSRPNSSTLTWPNPQTPKISSNKLPKNSVLLIFWSTMPVSNILTRSRNFQMKCGKRLLDSISVPTSTQPKLSFHKWNKEDGEELSILPVSMDWSLQSINPPMSQPSTDSLGSPRLLLCKLQEPESLATLFALVGFWHLWFKSKSTSSGKGTVSQMSRPLTNLFQRNNHQASSVTPRTLEELQLICAQKMPDKWLVLHTHAMADGQLNENDFIKNIWLTFEMILLKLLFNLVD